MSRGDQGSQCPGMMVSEQCICCSLPKNIHHSTFTIEAEPFVTGLSTNCFSLWIPCSYPLSSFLWISLSLYYHSFVMASFVSKIFSYMLKAFNSVQLVFTFQLSCDIFSIVIKLETNLRIRFCSLTYYLCIWVRLLNLF